MLINAKGISPLIATVLLIAFTITIAGLIMSFFLGFLGTQQTSTTEKSTIAMKCAYGKLKINSASYNGTSALLKIRITNEDQSTQDQSLNNITFSAITQDGSTNIYGATCNCADEALYPGETKFYSNSSVAGGCNITAVYVSSSCSNAKDSITSSSIDFSGC